MFDEHACAWSDARWGYYDLHYTPTSVFNGADVFVGSANDVLQQYNLYRVNHFLPERAVPTDVTLAVRATTVDQQSYDLEVCVGIDAGGTAKALQVQIVQVLDHWPDTKPYYRNGFKQAALPQDVSLMPGESVVIDRLFTLDADSLAAPQDVKIIAWAQVPAGTGPAYVYQAAIRPWPLDAPIDDWDGDGVLDAVDNCPRRSNGAQADADGDGAGDACDHCPDLHDPAQADTDEDGAGDACDNCPTLHSLDATDNDADGVGNPCDACPDVLAPGGVDASGRPLGALDLDCDVDVDDAVLLVACLAGPGTAPPGECTSSARADGDGDGDVDLLDLAGVQGNFTGPLISPAIYVGAANCLGCHTDQHAPWMATVHATAIDTLIASGDENNQLCLPCHSVGYAEPSGFVSLAATPELANVQCENCHGPGSNHVADPELFPLVRHYESAFCGSCHQSCHGLCGDDHHPQYEQWQTSQHATALLTLWAAPDAADECLQCHSTEYRLAPPDQKPGLWMVNTSLECVTCHGPHGTGQPGQLRLPRELLCADCHTLGWAEPSGEPPRQAQLEMLHSLAGWTLEGDLLTAPFTEHWWGIPGECVTCHVYRQGYGGPDQPVDSGHTFQARMRACLPCHTEEGATALVAAAHEEFALRMATIAPYFDPNSPWYIDPFDLPPDQFMPYWFALFNYDFVRADRSYGTHNPPYARALLNETETFLGIPPWPLRPAALEEDPP